MKRTLKVVLLTLFLFSGHASAWFIFIPGGAIRAIGDSITGAKGDICVKDTYKVGEEVTHPQTGNKFKVLSLSGTSSICTNPATPIRAEVEFTNKFASRITFELSEDYEVQPSKGVEIYNGRILFAKSKSVSSKYMLVSGVNKTPTTDMMQMANNMERSQIALLKEGVAQNSEKIEINGFNALRFEVVGTKKGVFGEATTYLITLIDTGSEIIVINQFISTNEYLNNKSEFLRIANSTKQQLNNSDKITTGILDANAIQTIPTTSDSQLNKIPPSKDINSTHSVITDKLSQLNNLKNKGLITQKDYDSKKAELLKSM
jgi:hypothetical protein